MKASSAKQAVVEWLFPPMPETLYLATGHQASVAVS